MKKGLFFLNFLYDLVQSLGDPFELFFSRYNLDMADPKPDCRTAYAEHGNGEHEQAGFIVRSHHVDTIDDQVTAGAQDQDHKNNLCPFLRSVIFTFFKHACDLSYPCIVPFIVVVFKTISTVCHKAKRI